jgi:metal-responsive CopG/Arc/MetJ family transcriptional regulator
MRQIKGQKKKRERPFYSSISLPAALVREVEKVVKELGYWPEKSAFMHEAVREKLEKCKKELEAQRSRESDVT